MTRPIGPTWATVVREARAEVQQWYRVPGRKEQVATLAEVLMARRVLRGEAWRKLVDKRPVQRPTVPLNLKPENVLCASSWRDFAFYGAGSIPFALS